MSKTFKINVMVQVSFSISNKKDLSVLIDIIEKYGYNPSVTDISKKKNKNIIALANSIKKRELTCSEIDKIIAEERNS